MKTRTKIVYFATLYLVIGTLNLISMYVESLLRPPSIWSMTTSAWIVVLVIALFCCLAGSVILLHRMSKLWELAENKIRFFIGMTLMFLGIIWVGISIKTLFN